MPSGRNCDPEAGNVEASTMSSAQIDDGLLRTKAYSILRKTMPKIAKMLDDPEQKWTIRKPVPYDLALPTMTRILRNMVAANDLEGVTEVLTKMQGHEKSDGFTIQDVAGNGLLQIAALHNFGKMTEMLLNNSFDIDYVDDNHGTALQAAIYMDSEDVLKVLLDEKRTPPANVNTVGGYYGCALQTAAFKGSSRYIALLIGRGADQDTILEKSKYGTALQAAARTGMPSILTQILALGNVQINSEGGCWGTALQAAAKGDYANATVKLRQLPRGLVLCQASEAEEMRVDYLEVAKILLANNAKVNMDLSGRLQTPINAAASSGQFEMLMLLLTHDDASEPERKAKYGRALLSAITQTFNRQRLPLVRELIRRGADVNFEAGNCLHNTPLTAAAAMNDEEVVAYLLETSENKQNFMNVKTGIYGCALRAALSAPHPAKDTALFLIRKVADTKNGDEAYGNILHLAAFANLPEIVSVLLRERNLQVNALDTNHQTALHIAAYRGYEQVVKILLDKGADANVKDAWGDLPLDIVSNVIGRESHPVPSLQGLRNIRDMLLKKFVIKIQQQDSGYFPGPITSLRPPQSLEPVQQKAKSVFESPGWNPGLKLSAKIVDFLERGEQEYVLVKDIQIDDLLYKKNAIADAVDKLEIGCNRKLRWIHLPTNNMTWAEMLIKILWQEEYENSICKSIWGTDPYFVQHEQALHARSVTPQCGRLINESFSESYLPKRSSCENTLFFAMPYVHWESYSSHVDISRLLVQIIADSSKTKIWRSHTGQINETYNDKNNEPRHLSGEGDGLSATKDAKGTDYDKEFLKAYLFKRWPVHLRRTLHQYYYSYLADTITRDRDQVVMRARQRKLQEEATFSALYVTTEREKDAVKKSKNWNWKKQKNAPNTSPQTKGGNPMPEKNSPVLMVDQLWLWVVSPSLVVTSFPQRASRKLDGDLDPEDKTDVLRTLLDYLRNIKRAPINNSYDLCELVVSQTVGILDRSDMSPELNFLKIFETQTQRAFDQVMTGLREFVDNYKGFMKWLNGRHKDADGYVKRFEEIVSVTHETQLFRDIQDMKEELTMLAAVFRDQKQVLEKVGVNIARSRAALLSQAGINEGAMPSASTLETNSSAFSFQQQSEKYAGDVKRMQDQASQANGNLQDVLTFKQQQANVLEANINQRQFITSKEQSKIIIIFTIVTIVFLPLTFMTTVFTLPVLEFPRYDASTFEPSSSGNLRSAYVFPIITGFTLAFTIPLITAAFNVTRLQHAWEGAKGFVERLVGFFSWGRPPRGYWSDDI